VRGILLKIVSKPLRPMLGIGDNGRLCGPGVWRWGVE